MTPPLDRDIEDTRDEEWYQNPEEPEADDAQFDWDRDTELERE